MRYNALKFLKIDKALQKMVDSACGIAHYAFGAHLRNSRTVPMYTIKQTLLRSGQYVHKLYVTTSSIRKGGVVALI
jgi:hypothetical protein